MRNRRRLRSLEKRTRILRARLTPKMICDARDHYFETGELPKDHPELAEIVVKLVEAVWAMKSTVPGPPWEEELWEIVMDPSIKDEEFETAVEDFLDKYPAAAPLVTEALRQVK